MNPTPEQNSNDRNHGCSPEPSDGNNDRSLPTISVVSPVYMAESSVEPLVERLIKSLNTIGVTFEIVLVEDGSPDNSWQQMCKQASLNSQVKAVRLSRNFGQHKAIAAGLDICCGDWVVVMDCDLQDKPEEIPMLYEVAQKGHEIVQAKRKFRRDSLYKRLLSKAFYAVLARLTGTQQDHSIANFGIYSRKVINAVQSLPESVRYFPLQIRWTGFKSKAVDVDHGDREFGETSYTFTRALRLAIDVMLSFSDKPLKMTIQAGMAILGVSFLMALWLMVRTFMNGFQGDGWLSLMASIWFLCGTVIIVLGMVGLYIGKIFEEVKNRPLYIVAETVQQKEGSQESKSEKQEDIKPGKQ